MGSNKAIIWFNYKTAKTRSYRDTPERLSMQDRAAAENGQTWSEWARQCLALMAAQYLREGKQYELHACSPECAVGEPF